MANVQATTKIDTKEEQKGKCYTFSSKDNFLPGSNHLDFASLVTCSMNNASSTINENKEIKEKTTKQTLRFIESILRCEHNVGRSLGVEEGGGLFMIREIHFISFLLVRATRSTTIITS